MLPDLPPLPAALGAAARAAFPGATVLPRGASPGLVWSRFPRAWLSGAPAQGKDQKDFLSAFVREYAAAGAVHGPLLADALARLAGLADATLELRGTGPFATGLGQDHPVENGFAFDPLVGVPILAGSGLKGLARAGAHLLGVPDDAIVRVLGSEPPKWGASEAGLRPGTVSFLGLWPTSWPKLKVELLNPHHASYQDDQARPPAERRHFASYVEEPIPVAFLAVAAGARFRAFLRGTSRARPEDVAAALPWLEAGFDFLGAGAKTGSGFGRMVRG